MHQDPEQLFTYIRSISELSEESTKVLGGVTSPVEFRKGDYLLKEGEVCSAIFFITKGYCRSMQYSDGAEINMAFYFEDDFASNTGSLSQRTASGYAIQACEALRAVRIDRDKLLEAYIRSPQIEAFGRKLLEMVMARQEEHAGLFKLLDAAERYKWVQQHQPEMIQRVPLTQLASYLGVSRETLSRIRAKK